MNNIDKIAKLIGTLDNDDLNKIVDVVKNHRKTLAMATKLNLSDLLEHEMINQIDFLQVDLSPPETTFEVLKNFPFDKITPRIVAFEHDAYADGDSVRDQSRHFMKGRGFKPLALDVLIKGKSFEDWWLDADLATSIKERFVNVEGTEIIRSLINNQS